MLSYGQNTILKIADVRRLEFGKFWISVNCKHLHRTLLLRTKLFYQNRTLLIEILRFNDFKIVAVRHLGFSKFAVYVIWRLSARFSASYVAKICWNRTIDCWGRPMSNKKLSCRRETAQPFLSLNILLSHSRSFETTLLRRAFVKSLLLIYQ